MHHNIIQDEFTGKGTIRWRFVQRALKKGLCGSCFKPHDDMRFSGKTGGMVRRRDCLECARRKGVKRMENRSKKLE